MVPKYYLSLAAVICVFFWQSVSGQNPVPDSLFGVDGIVKFDSTRINRVAAINGGKLALIIYKFNTFTTHSLMLKANGQTDSSYGINGRVQHSSGGIFDQKGRLYLYRITNQGQALDIERSYAGITDSTFGAFGVASFYPAISGIQGLGINKGYIDNKGNVITLGYVHNSSYEEGITITADSSGLPINLFRNGEINFIGEEDKINLSDYLIRKQDSLIVLVGSAREIGGPTRSLVKTIYENGSGETFFPNTGGIEKVQETGGGKILCMSFRNFHRIDPESGQLDATFGINGSRTLPLNLKDFVQVQGNRILAVSDNGKLVCLTQNGVVDSSFGTNGYYSLPSYNAQFWESIYIKAIDSLTILVSGGNKLYKFKLNPIVNTSTIKVVQEKRSMIFPNPATEKIQISTHHSIFEIHDVFGRKMAVAPLKNRSGFDVDLQYLPKGCYTLRLGIGTNSEYLRFVKE